MNGSTCAIIIAIIVIIAIIIITVVAVVLSKKECPECVKCSTNIQNIGKCRGPDPKNYDVLGSQLALGNSINPCQAIQSKNGQYLFVVQDDGVITLYNNQKIQLSFGSYGFPNRVELRPSGNLVAKFIDGTEMPIIKGDSSVKKLVFNDSGLALADEDGKPLFPYIVPLDALPGIQIKNLDSGLCVSCGSNNECSGKRCESKDPDQRFDYDPVKGNMKHSSGKCLDDSDTAGGNRNSMVSLNACDPARGVNQSWQYNPKERNIINRDSKMCITNLKGGATVIPIPCSILNTGQQWVLPTQTRYYSTAI